MFGSREPETTPTGRYRFQIVTGEMRQKTHERNVQEALNEGASNRWQLVSATTTNAAGSWVTSLYWDTEPERI